MVNAALAGGGLLGEACDSHAREAPACPSARRPPHSEPMAGSPLKRQRKLGVRREDGSIIAFPRMPRVADLPPGWRNLSPPEKIEHLLGMSLDRCYEILSWPMTDLDPFRLSVWMQVWRVVFAIGIKAYLDGSLSRAAGRERNRGAVFEEPDGKLGTAAD